MLSGGLAVRGYDWWWHSLTAHHEISGEPRGFFFEYFVTNPSLGGDEPVLGQTPANRASGRRPSYAMVNAGAWGNSPRQIHNYYGINESSFNRERLDVRIGDSIATETALSGRAFATEKDIGAHPEWMSDAGDIEWDLTARKILTYDLGFAASWPFRWSRAFQMFWHVQGIKTEYTGTITLDGERYVVEPSTSAGYQDKNWGEDFTNPWVWLNCANFTRVGSSDLLPTTCLDVGGGTPIVFGRRLRRKLIIGFFLEGKLFDFNFSKFWTRPGQRFECRTEGDFVTWNIQAWTRKARIEIQFACPKDEMLFMNYENPNGERNHRQLWNGGNARGTVRIFSRSGPRERLVEELIGTHGGCEYGEYR
jgi:tocopherol cyclase